MAERQVVKCKSCSTPVRKTEGVRYKNVWYHPRCYDLQIDKELFTSYVCKVFGLKSPGPVVYTQRKRFIEGYGYTDLGMYNALRFQFEIKKQKPENAKERIGFIPYVYDDAQAYYARKKHTQSVVASDIKREITNRKIELVKIKPKPKTVKLYELE